MWCNGSVWGPGYGWWFMPLFGIICMVIFLYVISRIFGNSSFRDYFPCGRQTSGKDQTTIDELKGEIRKLRAEILSLKEKKSEGKSL